MAGGPINGGAILPVVVPTVLQMSSDVIAQFTGLTCLYDRYWYARSDKATFPIALFYIKKMTEIRTSDISQQRVMLYEPPKPDSPNPATDPLRKGVMETVVDNIVNKPVQYKLEVIVPYSVVNSQFGRTIAQFNQILGAFSLMFGAEASAVVTNIMNVATHIFQGYREIVNLTDVVRSVVPEQQDYTMVNKQSLEAMWEAKRQLTFKLWTGYNYKYVIINDLSLEKQPTEDDVFRGSITLQELPVLSVAPVKPAGVNNNLQGRAKIFVERATALQSSTVQPLIAFTGVRSASGKPDEEP